MAMKSAELMCRDPGAWFGLVMTFALVALGL
jgi:hypothetical protein